MKLLDHILFFTLIFIYLYYTYGLVNLICKSLPVIEKSAETVEILLTDKLILPHSRPTTITSLKCTNINMIVDELYKKNWK